MKSVLGLVVLVFVVFFVVAIIAKKRGPGGPARWPYRTRTTVLSEVEQVLFWKLDEALPGLIVLAQVALNRVIDVEKKAPNRQTWRNKIDQKSLDYVICRKDT